jgi:hypothetical protein
MISYTLKNLIVYAIETILGCICKLHTHHLFQDLPLNSSGKRRKKLKDKFYKHALNLERSLMDVARCAVNTKVLFHILMMLVNR